MIPYDRARHAWPALALITGIVLLWLMSPTRLAAQPTELSRLTAMAPAQIESAPTASEAPKDPAGYKWWVVAPAILAILLAIVTRQVVPALVVGILAGAFMLLPCLPETSPYGQGNAVLGGFRLAAEHYLVGAIIDPDSDHGHVKIIIFTLVIGFVVGVIGRNGGTSGMVRLVAGDTESRRRGTLTAWFAGLLVFFDDYANTMIVGPTLRPVFDRLRISRAKLAYIVDSTAAPVASIALIGTWVGAEIGYIGQGLDSLGADRPAFLANVAPMNAFIASLAYRFYPIFALALVFWIALTERDFGPMKAAENRARRGEEEHPYQLDSAPSGVDEPKPRWFLGLAPVLVLVGVTVAVLIVSGLAAGGSAAIAGADLVWWRKASEVIGHADPYLCIFYGALVAAVASVLLTIIARACSAKDAIDAGLDGMARMFPAIVILVLAWALSQVEQDLKLGEVVAGYLGKGAFPPEWMPTAVFLAAAAISFATGTSWATMGLLCPMTVTITAKIAADLDPAVATDLFYASVGSVLAGAIFGDHCSPISDTTVLSSIASGCRHEDHVWTQIPYALVTAAVAIGVGDVMCSVFHQPWYYGLTAGVVLLLIIVLVVGRKPDPDGQPFSAMP